MQREEIEIMLRDNIADAEITVKSDDNTHFEAIIISDVFQNKKLLERQRLVYAIVGSHITSGAIHALSFKTYTQQEWKDKCGN